MGNHERQAWLNSEEFRKFDVCRKQIKYLLGVIRERPIGNMSLSDLEYVSERRESGVPDDEDTQFYMPERVIRLQTISRKVIFD